MINEVLHQAEAQMKKAVEALQHNLATIRTGRASPGLVEHLPIEVYEAMMPLNQLANISVPETRSILIQPYDAGTIRAIERGIQQSDLGLTPQNDGRIIRLTLPPLTEERRRELVRLVRHRVEEVKVSIRNHRRDALEDLREFEREKLISEDDLHRTQDRLQELTDRYTKELEQVGTTKEHEVMEV
ncbi:MAG: ribosome recycling factor [Chloroflexaceae bacterium]|nr:ribosome recycling factor [Chloroflexaceae bacterium]